MNVFKEGSLIYCELLAVSQAIGVNPPIMFPASVTTTQSVLVFLSHSFLNYGTEKLC